MSEWKRYVHVYQPDGVPDLMGQQACVCGLPKSNRLHKLPPTDPAVAEAEARRTGERMPAGQDQADAVLAAFDALARHRAA